jgi:molecular chaperone GrpE
VGEPEPPIKFVDRRRWAGGTDGAAGTDVPLRKPSYVEQLELQLAEKDAQLRDVIARYKEAAQEFDAARVRSRRDVVKEIERGKRAILAELLDVLDNLDRAIDAASNNPNIATLVHGVEMVREQFLARLEGFGVTRIAALGERFDPACHEAATTVPTADAGQRDRVVGVIRQGYRVAGDVLRPAIVAVAQATQPDSGPEGGDPTARS